MLQAMIEKFIIQGKKPLKGEVEIRGSKNAASKMMVASLLTDEPCLLENVPLSGEVEITKELCEMIGSKVKIDPLTSSCLIETSEIKTSLVPELSKKNRIPILALGPLLHRKGIAEVPVLGGCPIGHRPINFHIEALTKMGIKIERREHSYFAQCESIHGADIYFPWTSVGATENVLLAAVLAKGKTSIENAAMEPEVINLVEMLNGMGAQITVDGKKQRIEIQGVPKLRGVSVSVIPDRNEIVSFAVAALTTGGSIFLPRTDSKNLESFIEKVRNAGGSVSIEKGGIRFSSAASYRGIFIETAPFPGFMTDWQQPFSVLLTQAEGESIIHETVYEDRFGYIKDLKRMGASVAVSTDCPQGVKCRYFGEQFNHVASIKGPTPLHGVSLEVKDLRAGMAHVIAALAAEGESVISGIEHIDRGYEKIDERLHALGADIQRVRVEQVVESKSQLVMP